MGQIAIIELAGAGSAINLDLGFVPDYVKLTNNASPAVTTEWYQDDGAGTYIQAYNPGDSVTHGTDTDPNNPGADGVEVSGFQGITVAAGMAVSGKTVRGFAIKADRVRTS